MFAILFEVLLIEIQEEIHHFAGWEGGGVKGRKNFEQKFCEQTGVSSLWCGSLEGSFLSHWNGPSCHVTLEALRCDTA